MLLKASKKAATQAAVDYFCKNRGVFKRTIVSAAAVAEFPF
jgi:hypothetical protein